jgi:glycosyltransferase involved in cell wall biosynthesis
MQRLSDFDKIKISIMDLKHHTRNKNVLLDTRMLVGKQTGVGRYLTHLVQEMIAIAPPDLSFSALCLREDKLPDGIIRHVLDGMASGARPLGPLQQFVVPWSVRQAGCNLYHYSSFDPPWLLPRPFVTTCYDIEPLRHPELFSTRIVWYYRIFTIGLQRAERIFVISESTGRDLVDLLHISPERIKVTYLGVDSSFHPVKNPDTLAMVRKRYILPERYVLYLGNTMPHKNLPRLIAAMAYVHQQEPDVKLLLAGHRDKYRPIIERAIATADLENVVRFLGDILEGDLPVILNEAQVFAYPSLYEGFGLPVLEAMACGTPVVTSNCSSLPEVVGDCAIKVNPENPSAIGDGILRLLLNPAEGKHFSNAGIQRAHQFTWRSCAEKHIEVYREVLAG